MIAAGASVREIIDALRALQDPVADRLADRYEAEHGELHLQRPEDRIRDELIQEMKAIGLPLRSPAALTIFALMLQMQDDFEAARASSEAHLKNQGGLGIEWMQVMAAYIKGIRLDKGLVELKLALEDLGTDQANYTAQNLKKFMESIEKAIEEGDKTLSLQLTLFLNQYY